MYAHAPELPPLPLAGRRDDQTALEHAVERLRGGARSVLFVSGEAGVGKSRLVAALADGCRQGGWQVAEGRAYAVETGVPFAAFSDALVPLLSETGRSALEILSRGGSSALVRLFPALADAPLEAESSEEVGERTHLFWSLARVLSGLSGRRPLLLVLDDLHWCDPSSLELLHFLARQLSDAPAAIVGTINEAERDTHPALARVERSLQSAGLSEEHRLAPLSCEAVGELLRESFGVGAAASATFARRLWERTGGNALMIEATLGTLVEQRALRKERGTWVGWEVTDVGPRGPVRSAVLQRLETVSPHARATLEVIAVAGGRARHDVVRSACELSEPELTAALEQLRRRSVLEERVVDGWPVYDLRHPLLGEVLVGEMAAARLALLHLRIAEALEARYGTGAVDHAYELALHFTRGELGASSTRALPYLAAAGRKALARFADHEAADYLRQALERTTETGRGRAQLLEDLGRALRRTGDVSGAVELWGEAISEAEGAGDVRATALLRRRIGLAHYFAGQQEAALEAYDRALADARSAADPEVLGRVLVARGTGLQGIGRVEEAERDLAEALALADGSEDDALLARTHRALLLFHTWSGPPDRARSHAREAVRRAAASGDLGLSCTCHWAVAVLEGLSGNAAACVQHTEAARRLAEQVGSPLLEVAIAEVQVEYAFGCGDWDTALAVGERAIALCRSLGQHASLPRILVWTGLVHLGRDDLERADAYLEEAWAVSGAGREGRGSDVHAVVPAHIGLAARHLALGEVNDAVQLARAALAIVDRTGYRRWAAHRLLPVLAEACLVARDLEGARAVGERIRKEADALDDPLARAWADACDALALWLGGSGEEAASALRAAAEELEAVPFLPDALRVRRRLAACLAELGDREAAIQELRRIHEGFARLRAERELAKTRRALHDIGARPPTRAAAPGAHGLTSREWDVLDGVRARKSNKAIARALQISPRTVERHLTNIFKKLGLSSRSDLVELARTLPRGGSESR